MYNPFSLEGKTILVTGASSGIGTETAVECSRLGASLVITGRNEERLKETFSRLDTACSQHHKMVIADLTDEADLAFLSETTDFLDGLVSNVGINRVKPLSFIKQEDFDLVFKSNTFSGINLIRLLLKKKKLNRNCSIVFTSSVAAFHNAPGRALYSSSKAALTALMRSVALELADKGIRANAVHPGMVETRLIHESLSDEELEKDRSGYPLKRFGRPEEIAWAIAYLLSDAASWVTGTSLTIDGGFMLK